MRIWSLLAACLLLPIFFLGRLSVLIKGWSTISLKFSRRDSCEFTTCVSPCVRKATTHLQQLKDHIANLSPVQEAWSSSLVDCHPKRGIIKTNINKVDNSRSRKGTFSFLESPSKVDHFPMSYVDSFAASSIESSSMQYSPLSEIVPYDNGNHFQSSNHSPSQVM